MNCIDLVARETAGLYCTRVTIYSFETKRKKKLCLNENCDTKIIYFFQNHWQICLNNFLIYYRRFDWYHSKEVLETHANKLALPFMLCTTAAVSQLYIKLCEKESHNMTCIPNSITTFIAHCKWIKKSF